ncbi:MAG: DUF4357 domain-containing protein [Candidatus Methanoplasma sp.]|jgi:hypothetical protein|nr:DUF4357 domain-containing protein [Candidatus Methanoplasma sp.]
MKEFRQNIADLLKEITDNESETKTEEDRKMHMVIPLLNALGWKGGKRIHSESSGDSRGKDRVDYTLSKDGRTVALVECKKDLDADRSRYRKQLERYFNTGNEGARLGILTDGCRYEFFSDLETSNRMDNEPFLSFDIHSITDADIGRMSYFSHDSFDQMNIKRIAEHSRISRTLDAEMANPADKLLNSILGIAGVKSNQCNRDHLRAEMRLYSKCTQTGPTETGLPRSNTEEDNLYFSPSRKLVGKLYVSNVGTYILCKGSVLSDMHGEEGCYESIISKRKGCADLIDRKSTTLEDIEFDTPSGAGSFIAGTSVNGWTFWKTEDGTVLDELYNRDGTRKK